MYVIYTIVLKHSSYALRNERILLPARDWLVKGLFTMLVHKCITNIVRSYHVRMGIPEIRTVPRLFNLSILYMGHITQYFSCTPTSNVPT